MTLECSRYLFEKTMTLERFSVHKVLTLTFERTLRATVPKLVYGFIMVCSILLRILAVLIDEYDILIHVLNNFIIAEMI